MKGRAAKFAIILTYVAAAAFAANAQAASPKNTVMAFYKFDRANSQAFNRANIDARKRWLSDELYKALINELSREKEFLAANPDEKPHYGDGLPFRPSDEACTAGGKEYRRAVSFGTVTVKGDLANVDVRFKYPAACGIPDILYAVNMSREKGRWVIDDIRYFPENTSLMEDLGRKEY